jgi:rod shape-determining protein MreC
VPGQRKYAFFALFTLSICILALYIHRHRQGQTGRIDNFLISSAGALQQQLIYFTQGSRTIVDRYVLLVNTKRQNETLEKEVGELRNRLAQFQDVELENARLRESLDFKDKVAHHLTPAHVVAHDVSSDYFGIRIDKGADQGVRVGMGVISPSGVVGRIHRVSPHYADVLTLVDPTSNIDAIIQRSRARGIISGLSKQLTCKMKYIDRLEDVAVNDTVLSSGFGEIFPKGLLVGYVTAVMTNANGILQTVTVKSAVDIYRLEEVFIVFPPGEPEKTS